LIAYIRDLADRVFSQRRDLRDPGTPPEWGEIGQALAAAVPRGAEWATWGICLAWSAVAWVLIVRVDGWLNRPRRG
jgi:hypothetical protein